MFRSLGKSDNQFWATFNAFQSAWYRKTWLLISDFEFCDCFLTSVKKILIKNSFESFEIIIFRKFYSSILTSHELVKYKWNALRLITQ